MKAIRFYMTVIAAIALFALGVSAYAGTPVTKSYYPTVTRDNVGNELPNIQSAEYVEFYDNLSYIVMNGNRYNYIKTMPDGTRAYLPVDKGWEGGVYVTGNLEEMYYVFSVDVMGYTCSSNNYFICAGDGRDLALNFDPKAAGTQVHEDNDYSLTPDALNVYEPLTESELSEYEDDVKTYEKYAYWLWQMQSGFAPVDKHRARQYQSAMRTIRHRWENRGAWKSSVNPIEDWHP